MKQEMIKYLTTPNKTKTYSRLATVEDFESKMYYKFKGYQEYDGRPQTRSQPVVKKAITREEINRNIKNYKRLRKDPIPRVSSSNSPIMSTAPLRPISDKKFNFIGRGKSMIKTKSIPSPIRKGGLLGSLATGAISMLNISIMKGAMNPSRGIVLGRYMQDLAMSKNLLNSSRLGLSAGTSRSQDLSSTMGLSNALSRSRHGRF